MKFITKTKKLKSLLRSLYPIINYNHSKLPYRYLLISKEEDKIEIKAQDDYSVGTIFLELSDYKEEGEEKQRRQGDKQKSQFTASTHCTKSFRQNPILLLQQPSKVFP